MRHDIRHYPGARLFTAVFFTRLVFDLVYKGRRRLQTLSI